MVDIIQNAVSQPVMLYGRNPNGDLVAVTTDANGNLNTTAGSGGAGSSVSQAAGGGIANAWTVEITDGVNAILGSATHPIRIDPTGTTVQPVSGTVTVSDPAEGVTGSAVPADAIYVGINIAGNLTGLTGISLTNAKAATVAIVDGSGNQITSFGGGTQFADNAASGATPTGTLAMGWDSSLSKIRALKVDASQNLNVNLNANSFGTLTVSFPSAQHVIVDSATLGTVAENLTQVGGSAIAIGQAAMAASLPVVIASNQSTVNVSVQNATLAVTQSTSPWVDNVSQFGGNAVVTGTGAGGVGIPRVTVSNDSNILATQSGTWTNRIVGNAGAAMDAAQNAAAPANELVAGGVFQTTIPALSAGNASQLQVDSTGALMVNPEGRKASYRIGIINFTPVASSTSPSVSLQGSGTKTIRITRIRTTLTNTTGSTTPCNIILQRFSVLTGGTTGSTPTLAKNDTNNANGTGVVLQYSAVPTTATAVGGIIAVDKAQNVTESASTVSTILPVDFRFGDVPGSQEIVLRGTGDFLGIMYSALGTTPSASLWLEWTEE